MRPWGWADAPWEMVVGLLVLCGVLLALRGWARARERRGDWGPGILHPPDESLGYSMADLRGSGRPTDTGDAEDRLMRGLAAPFVEQAGMLHERWSLVPAFCDAAWRRRVLETLDGWGVRRAAQWRRVTDDAEVKLRALTGRSAEDPARFDAVGFDVDGYTADDIRAARALSTARLAMLLRLGVAARHVSGSRARRRLRPFVTSVRTHTPDWFSYGDAFVRGYAASGGARPGEMRADVRVLYDERGPWRGGRF